MGRTAQVAGRKQVLRVSESAHRAVGVQATLQGVDLSDLAEDLILWALQNKPGLVRWAIIEDEKEEPKKPRK